MSGVDPYQLRDALTHRPDNLIASGRQYYLDLGDLMAGKALPALAVATHFLDRCLAAFKREKYPDSEWRIWEDLEPPHYVNVQWAPKGREYKAHLLQASIGLERLYNPFAAETCVRISRQLRHKYEAMLFDIWWSEQAEEFTVVSLVAWIEKFWFHESLQQGTVTLVSEPRAPDGQVVREKTGEHDFKVHLNPYAEQKVLLSLYEMDNEQKAKGYFPWNTVGCVIRRNEPDGG